MNLESTVPMANYAHHKLSVTVCMYRLYASLLLTRFSFSHLQTCQHSQLTDVLRVLVDTIVFHRSLGIGHVKEASCRFADVRYFRILDVDGQVSRELDVFSNSMRSSSSVKNGTLNVFFYAKKSTILKKNKSVWECWSLPVQCMHSGSIETTSSRATLEHELRENMLKIIRICNDEKLAPLPPVDSYDPTEWTLTPFSCETERENSGWGSMFTQMFKTKTNVLS